MPLVIDFEGRLDACALHAACEAVIRRHAVLSSAVAEDDGLPVMVAGAAAGGPADHRHGPRPNVVREETLAPFDVENGPLARFVVAKLGPERHALVFVAHHLVFDGESKDILVRDLADFYNGESRPRPGDVLRELRRGGAGARPGRPRRGQGLLGSRPNTGSAPARGAAADDDDCPASRRPVWARPRARCTPSARTDARRARGLPLRALPGARCTPCCTGYGNPDPTVAVDLSTRIPDVRDNIGLFVNELPVTVHVQGTRRRRRPDPAPRAARDVPLPACPLCPGGPGVRPRTALAQVSVSYRKRRPDPVFAGVKATVDWAVFNRSVRSLLHLQAVDHPDGLYVIMQYGVGSGTESDVARIAEDLLTIMNNPDIPVDGTPQAAGLDDAIREIWQEVLGIDEIGDDEDLFDLGGHSLTITQIIARMRKRLGVEVPLDVFFDTPTIAGVVQAIREAEPAVR